MKPSQIQPGTLYAHKSFPNTIYMGIGTLSTNPHKPLQEYNPRSKKLVVVFHKSVAEGEDEARIQPNLYGFTVNPPSVAGQDFWDNFYPLPDNTLTCNFS